MHRLRNARIGTLSVACLAVFATSSIGFAQAPAPPSVRTDAPYLGDRVVRVRLRDARDLRTMLALSDDVWSHRVEIGSPADFRVGAEAFARLTRTGLDFDVLIEDVQGLVDAERARLRDAGAEGGVAGADFYADFQPLEAIEARLEAIAAAHPDRASVVEIGTSIEGRTILGVRLAPPDSEGLPHVVINAAQHAREWATPPTALWLIEALVERSDPAVAAVADQAVWTVIPIVNPDGYHHSWGPERLWRKNRRVNEGGSIGVDLNRNWGYGWGGEGSSGTPTSETYRGTAAFSEPETAALRDYLASLPEVAAHLDIHSYGQWILHPWGNMPEPPPDGEGFTMIGARMAEAILSTSGKVYVPGAIYTLLYPASGGSCDWVYAEEGAYSLAVEVRDTGGYGFVMPPSEIVPNAEENLAAIVALASTAIAPAAFLVESPPATIEAGEVARVPVRIVPFRGEIVPETAIAVLEIDGEVENVLLDAVGANLYEVPLPAMACGTTLRWRLEVETSLGTVAFPEGTDMLETVAVETEIFFADDFEADLGWTVGGPADTATAGIWERVAPIATSAQPGSDHSPDGTICFITGQHPGGGAGENDVDGGITTLTSPPFDATDPETAISVWLWHSNSQGSNPGQDSMLVEVSCDGGASWTLLAEIADSPGVWFERAWRVADFVAGSDACHVRFIARDLGGGSLVEAGVDDFVVLSRGCGDRGPLGDLDGDGVVGGADLALLLGAWGGSGPLGDLDGDGVVGGADLAVLLGAWGG